MTLSGMLRRILVSALIVRMLTQKKTFHILFVTFTDVSLNLILAATILNHGRDDFWNIKTKLLGSNGIAMIWSRCAVWLLKPKRCAALQKVCR